MTIRVQRFREINLLKAIAIDFETANEERGSACSVGLAFIEDGKVVRVEDKEIGLEIAQGVTIKVVKGMIAEVRVRGEPAPANDSKA